MKLGKSIIENEFIAKNKTYNDKLIDPVLKRLNFKSRKSLFIALGKSEITSSDVTNIILPKKSKLIEFIYSSKIKNNKSISLKALKPGVAIHCGVLLSFIW